MRTLSDLFRFLALASVTFIAFGQSIGRISGSVEDQSGAAIASATVLATNTETQLKRTAQTNGEGIFVFPDLPIGTYTVDTTVPGFSPARKKGVALLTGQSLNLKFSMSLGQTSQSVQVTEGAPLIQTDSAAVQNSVNQTQMQHLPLNGRNALQLTALTPGTVLTNVGTESGQQDNTGLSINGLRATQNNFLLDGTMYTNRFFDSVPTMTSLTRSRSEEECDWSHCSSG